jgi:hypothetical protein
MVFLNSNLAYISQQFNERFCGALIPLRKRGFNRGERAQLVPFFCGIRLANLKIALS